MSQKERDEAIKKTSAVMAEGEQEDKRSDGGGRAIEGGVYQELPARGAIEALPFFDPAETASGEA